MVLNFVLLIVIIFLAQLLNNPGCCFHTIFPQLTEPWWRVASYFRETVFSAPEIKKPIHWNIFHHSENNIHGYPNRNFMFAREYYLLNRKKLSQRASLRGTDAVMGKREGSEAALGVFGILTGHGAHGHIIARMGALLATRACDAVFSKLSSNDERKNPLLLNQTTLTDAVSATANSNAFRDPPSLNVSAGGIAQQFIVTSLRRIFHSVTSGIKSSAIVNSGATLSIAVWDSSNDLIYVANLGNSLVFQGWKDKEKAKIISCDHSMNNSFQQYRVDYVMAKYGMVSSKHVVSSTTAALTYHTPGWSSNDVFSEFTDEYSSTHGAVYLSIDFVVGCANEALNSSIKPEWTLPVPIDTQSTPPCFSRDTKPLSERRATLAHSVSQTNSPTASLLTLNAFPATTALPTQQTTAPPTTNVLSSKFSKLSEKNVFGGPPDTPYSNQITQDVLKARGFVNQLYTALPLTTHDIQGASLGNASTTRERSGCQHSNNVTVHSANSQSGKKPTARATKCENVSHTPTPTKPVIRNPNATVVASRADNVTRVATPFNGSKQLFANKVSSWVTPHCQEGESQTVLKRAVGRQLTASWMTQANIGPPVLETLPFESNTIKREPFDQQNQTFFEIFFQNITRKRVPDKVQHNVLQPIRPSSYLLASHNGIVATQTDPLFSKITEIEPPGKYDLEESLKREPLSVPLLAKSDSNSPAARGQAYIDFFVTDTPVEYSMGDKCYFVDVRLGNLAVASAIGDDGPIGTLTSRSFVQRNPSISIYRFARPSDYLLLTSSGFSKPFFTSHSANIYKHRILRCNPNLRSDCLPNPLSSFHDWTSNNSDTRLPNVFIARNNVVRENAKAALLSQIQSVINKVTQNTSSHNLGYYPPNIASLLVDESSRVDANSCRQSGEDISVLVS